MLNFIYLDIIKSCKCNVSRFFNIIAARTELQLRLKTVTKRAYILVFIVITMTQIMTIIHDSLEYKNVDRLGDLLKFPLIILIFLITYILFDIKTINKKIKEWHLSVIAIIVSALIFALILSNMMLFSEQSFLDFTARSKDSKLFFMHMFIEGILNIGGYQLIVCIIHLILRKVIFINRPAAKEYGFLSKIPALKEKDIYLIKAKENYIEVYTKNGDKKPLINYRLSRAVEEITPDLGVQVHRSYWASTELLEKIKKHKDSKTYIKTIKMLKDGD